MITLHRFNRLLPKHSFHRKKKSRMNDWVSSCMQKSWLTRRGHRLDFLSLCVTYTIVHNFKNLFQYMMLFTLVGNLYEFTCFFLFSSLSVICSFTYRTLLTNATYRMSVGESGIMLKMF